MDGADVCRTSRRPPDVISDLAILDPRWRGRKWRHPGPGARFSTPIAARGAKWRPFRFRSPSWMTSFAGTGNEVIQDGDRKRKGRHFAPRAAMGVEKRALYYYYTVEGSNLGWAHSTYQIRLLEICVSTSCGQVYKMSNDSQAMRDHSTIWLLHSGIQVTSTLEWMPEDLVDGNSTLFQVMALCY